MMDLYVLHTNLLQSYGIFARVDDASEIERVMCIVNELKFWCKSTCAPFGTKFEKP